MCQIFSCIVVPDGRVLTSSDVMQHSHTKIRAEHGIADTISINQAANVEVVPATGEDLLSDPDGWKIILDHEREPAWWAEDKPALEHRCREEVVRWQRRLRNLTALDLGCTSLSGENQDIPDGR